MTGRRERMRCVCVYREEKEADDDDMAGFTWHALALAR
jgi:hypothetical protein